MKKLLWAPIPEKTKSFLRSRIGYIKNYGKPKVFGIGCNKTGTTSLKKAMGELGFEIGNQRVAENLFSRWAKREFREIVKYCKTAQFFQDVPFSLPYTYVAIDQEFPGSKFILTVRDSPEQWYESVVKFDINKWGSNGNLPTKKELLEADYIYSGWLWEFQKQTYGVPESDFYNRDILIKFYTDHNMDVMTYFRNRPDDLLVLNVAEGNACQKLCAFLDLEPILEAFPWENRTSDINERKLKTDK